MDLICTLYLSLFLVLKSDGMIHTGNFIRETTYGKLGSYFKDLTVNKKMKCATYCQEDERCVCFSVRSQSVNWVCQLSETQHYTSDVSGAVIYKHKNRGMLLWFNCPPSNHQMINVPIKCHSNSYCLT